MAITKRYCREEDDEIFYSIAHFKSLLEIEELDEMTLIEGVPEKVNGMFWCQEYESVGDKSEGGCGKECKGYAPRNGKSGCCKHYTTTFYEPSDKEIIIKRK